MDENPVGSPQVAICTFGNVFWRSLVLSSATQAQKMAANYDNAGI
jgi:hypothetical protein